MYANFKMLQVSAKLWQTVENDTTSFPFNLLTITKTISGGSKKMAWRIHVISVNTRIVINIAGDRNTTV